MSIRIFGSPLSPFVMKVQGVLHLKNLEYELLKPSGPGDLRKHSPVTGKIPTAVVGGENLYDSTFIVERLDRDHPEPPVWSEDPQARAAQRLLEDWADESLYFHLMALRLTKASAPKSVAQVTETMSAPVRLLAGPVLRRLIASNVRAQGMGRLPEADVVRELAARMDDLEMQLGETPYFFSDAPSVADLAVAAQLNVGLSGPTPQFDELLKTRAGLRGHLERVQRVARWSE